MKKSLGIVSLWSAILGLVLPGCWLVDDLVFQGKLLNLGWGGLYFLIAFFPLELVALACGIDARRRATGKVGLIISAGVLLAFLLFEVYAFIRFSVIGDRPPMQPPPPPRPP